MRPGLLVSGRHSLPLVSVLIYRPCGVTALGLRLQEVSDRYAWGPPLHLYRPIGCQGGSRLGDYNNNPPNAISFMPVIAGTSGRLHSEFVRRLLLQAHRETDRFHILQLQEFSWRNMTVDCSTSAARRSPHSSSLKWAAPSSRLQLYE
jgi:hypothetical protein